MQLYCLLGKERDFAEKAVPLSSFGSEGYKHLWSHLLTDMEAHFFLPVPSFPGRSLVDHIPSSFFLVSHQQTHTTLHPFLAGNADFSSVQIFAGLSLKRGCENQRRESKLSWSAVIKNKWGKTVSWRTDENQLCPGRCLAYLVFVREQWVALELHPPDALG